MISHHDLRGMLRASLRRYRRSGSVAPAHRVQILLREVESRNVDVESLVPAIDRFRMWLEAFKAFERLEPKIRRAVELYEAQSGISGASRSDGYWAAKGFTPPERVVIDDEAAFVSVASGGEG